MLLRSGDGLEGEAELRQVLREAVGVVGRLLRPARDGEEPLARLRRAPALPARRHDLPQLRELKPVEPLRVIFAEDVGENIGILDVRRPTSDVPAVGRRKSNVAEPAFDARGGSCYLSTPLARDGETPTAETPRLR